MIQPLRQISRRVARRLWGVDAAALPRWKRLAVRTGRIAYAVLRDLLGGQLTLHAMGLVYTTLLSLIPLLAVSFSVLKAFQIQYEIEPMLQNFLRPLGEKGDQLTNQVIASVEGLNVGVLSSVGVALLFFTVFTLIQKIERAFNFAWHIRHQRQLSRHFEYLSVIVIGPPLILAAFGLTASMMGTRVVTRLREIEPVGAVFSLTGQLLPYLLAIATFTFFYLLVPNTKVKLGSALIGALVAGLLWEGLSRAFSSIVVTSARYEAIVSGFAIPLLFMIWLYLGWLILLVGATVAFYHQHPEFLGVDREELRLSNRLREKLSLLLVYLIGRRHYSGEEPWTVEDLGQRLGLPVDVVSAALERLEESRIVAASGDKESVFLPARPFDTLTLAEVLESVRASGEGPFLRSARLAAEPPVERLEGRLRGAAQEALAGRTVKDWVVEETA